jgi:hypothetical protein
MSFWGGFVQGFAESVDKAIQKDIERTNEIVDDTVKIGINKYLDNETEIKKEKAQIREEVNMLKALNFSLPKIASIVSAGQTANIIKLANKSTKDPDELWNGTTKFAEENGLTVNDVINKLVRTPKFSMGDIQVQSSGLLANLGLAQDLGTRIKTGIGTRVGGISKAVDTRDDIAVMPGGLTSEAKSLLTTSSDGVDETIAKLLKKKFTVNGVLDEKGYLEALYKVKYPDMGEQLVLENSGNFKGLLRMSVNQLKRLDEIYTKQYPNDPKKVMKLLNKEIGEIIRNSNGVLSKEDLIKAIK